MNNTARPGRLHLRIGKYKGIGEHDEYHVHALLFGHDGQPQGPFGMMDVYVYHEGTRRDFVFGEGVMREALPDSALESIADALRRYTGAMDECEMRAMTAEVGRWLRPLRPCFVTWQVNYTVDYE